VGETGNLGKRLEWRDQDETWWVGKCRRYVIDITGLDPLSLGELGGEVQCFGEVGASPRLLLSRFPRFNHMGG